MQLRSKVVSRRSFLGLTAGVAGAAVLAACGGGDGDSTPAPAATEATGAESTHETGSATPSDSETPEAGSGSSAKYDTENIVRGGHVTFANNGDISTLIPILSTDANSSSVINLIYEPLLIIDPETLQPAPRLAATWEVGEDNKTYTFTLKEGVLWQDGETLTAEDVIRTWELAMDLETGAPMAAKLSDRVASVEATDDQTVVITLNEVVAPFLVTDLAGVRIMPAHHLEGVAPADLKSSALAEKPVGTGAFIFEERQPGEYVRLVKFADHHLGEPALDQVIIKVGRDNTANYQQLKTGEIDALAITPAFQEDAEKQEHLEIRRYESFGFNFIGFNLDLEHGSPIFQDKRVRQALCYAIPRQEMVDHLENGNASVAVGIYPPISWAYQPEGIELKYEYDLEKAAALLEEAGWEMGPDGVRVKDGQRLSFTMTSLAGSKRFEGFTAVMQESWAEIGAEMTVRNEEFAAYIASLTQTHEFETFVLGTSASFDPDVTQWWASDQWPEGNNLVRYSNPEVDRLLKEGVSTLDLEERKAIYLELQNILLEEVPMFVLLFPQTVEGVNKRFKNYHPNPVYYDDNPNAHLWYVTDGK